MTRDTRRQLATIAAFVVTLALNGAANALPLNGQTTASISDRLPTLVTPAGYVFAIWAVIYLLQLAFTVHQARPSRATIHSSGVSATCRRSWACSTPCGSSCGTGTSSS